MKEKIRNVGQGSSPQDPGVIRLHVNATYFSTTAGWVTSPTRGHPPPCKQGLTHPQDFIVISDDLMTVNMDPCLFTLCLILMSRYS